MQNTQKTKISAVTAVLIAAIAIVLSAMVFSLQSPAFADDPYITAEDFVKLYDGEASPIPFTVREDITEDMVEVTYLVNGQTQAQPPVQIGSYSAALTYDDFTVTATYMIVAPLTAQNYSKTYDGVASPIPFTLDELVPEEMYPNVLYVGEGYESDEPPLSVGSYTATLSLGAYTLERTYTISTGIITSAVFSDAKILHDGKEHSIFVEGLGDGFDIVYAGNGVKEVGLYTVTATISKENYSKLVLQAKIYIMSKELASSGMVPSAIIYSDAGIEPQLALLVLDKSKDEESNNLLADALETKESTTERVSAIYQLKLSEDDASHESYTIKILIPEAISKQWNMRLLRVNEASTVEMDYVVEGDYCVFKDSTLGTYAFLTTEATEGGEKAATIIFYGVLGGAGLIILLVLAQFLRSSHSSRRSKKRRRSRYV